MIYKVFSFGKWEIFETCLVQGDRDDVRDMPGENLTTRRAQAGVCIHILFDVYYV
jgi:hypothetical protein